MKTYNVKYERGTEVYILQNKKIIKSSIEKIRIYEKAPYIDADNNMKEMDGVTIEYLVEIDNGASYRSYDWYKQEDVFLSKDEVLRQII
jgi:hypothetical protein